MSATSSQFRVSRRSWPYYFLGFTLILAIVFGLGSAPTQAADPEPEPISSLDILQPLALDSRKAEDGTPIALKIGSRVIGARQATAPLVADLSSDLAGERYFFDCQAADGGDGTQARPFNTLAQSQELQLGPGDQVLLKTGTECTGQLLLTGSGTEQDKIIVDAYGDPADGRPVLNGNGVESVVRINQGEHWVIRNLEITNRTNDDQDYTTPRRGIIVALTDYGRGKDYLITNNYIHHVWGKNEKDLGGSGGIQFEAYAGDEVIPTAFDEVEISYNRIENVNRSGINVGSNFRTRPSVGPWIQDNPFFAWGPMQIHDNVLSNIGGDAIVNQFAQGSLISNNTVWNSSNHHGGKSNNGNNAAVWAWDSDYVTFRANHVFNTVMPDGTWDSTAFDSDYGTTGTTFEYNVSHDNQGGFVLFCGCGGEGGISTDTVMRYNISLNDGKGGENHKEGARLFFNAGQSDGKVYNNTFLLYPGVEINAQASNATAVTYSNNVFLAQGDVRSADVAAEQWRRNLFAGTWTRWPQQGENNQVAAGLHPAPGTGLVPLKVKTASVIAQGLASYQSLNEGVGFFDDEPAQEDIEGGAVPIYLTPDVGAFQLTDFPQGADVLIQDGGFDDETDSPWQLSNAELTTSARNGEYALNLANGTATQVIPAPMNRTFRITAAIKGEVQVSVELPSVQENPVVALAKNEGALRDGWKAVSTVIRTAANADELTIAVSGTGVVDDIALTEIPDYVVDGSFESPTNSPWGGSRSTTESVTGNYSADLGSRASFENNEVVLPDAGSYELWGWGMGPSPMVLGVKNTGTQQVVTEISGQQWTQGMTTFDATTSKITAFCYAGSPTPVAGLLCDDVSVTPVWDQTAPAVAATADFVIPEAPSDPPAPPKPVEPVSDYVPFSDVTVVGASSENPGDGLAINVNKDGASPIWHTQWDPTVAAPPHWITLQVADGYLLRGLDYLPRQDDSWNGVAKQWHIEGSADADFTDPVTLASGTWDQTTDLKHATFTQPTNLPFVRLYIDSHYGDGAEDQFGSAAMIRLVGQLQPEPSASPSASPTEPSASPSAPSASPTEPSASPSEPTETPSSPTAGPTEPSMEPTQPPTAPPSAAPSGSPTDPARPPSKGPSTNQPMPDYPRKPTVKVGLPKTGA